MMADAQANSCVEVPEPVVLNTIASCLRNSSRTKNLTNRSVSFPEDDNQIVTGYLEPPNPWEYAERTNKEAIISNYVKSCEKHATRPIPSVLQQLQELELDGDGARLSCLSLKGEPLVTASCEALEEILKRIQFVKLDLEATDLEDEAAAVLFDMIEYYEAATHLIISNNNNIAVRGWQACSRMLKRTKCLEELDCRSTNFSEQYMSILCRALRAGSQIQVLRLENCSLPGRPIVILVAALKLNTGLRELYLGENALTQNDAFQLGALLRTNSTLQLLDISNNCIEDAGLKSLCDGLCEQVPTPGLNVLILWNNRLTANSSAHIARVLQCKTLEILNVGRNMLGDDVLHVSKDALLCNRTLLRLGMQSTHLTCQGAISLAEIIAVNSVIQRIDLRDNNIMVGGLMALSASMKVNKSITQLDLDPVPKNKMSGDDFERYSEHVEEIKARCKKIEEAWEAERAEEADEGLDGVSGGSGSSRGSHSKMGTLQLRKISLTCDTMHHGRTWSSTSEEDEDEDRVHLSSGLLIPGSDHFRRGGGRLRSPAPSPIPSPVASPSPTRTRFQVSKVSEGSPGVPPDSPSSPGNSRFRVTTVTDSPPPPQVTTSSPSPNQTQGFFPVPVSLPVPVPSSPARAAEPRASPESRSRKTSTWALPSAQIITESNKAIERLLGFLPWSGRGGSGGGGGGGGGEAGSGRPESSQPAQDLINNNQAGGSAPAPAPIAQSGT